MVWVVSPGAVRLSMPFLIDTDRNHNIAQLTQQLQQFLIELTSHLGIPKCLEWMTGVQNLLSVEDYWLIWVSPKEIPLQLLNCWEHDIPNIVQFNYYPSETKETVVWIIAAL